MLFRLMVTGELLPTSIHTACANIIPDLPLLLLSTTTSVAVSTPASTVTVRDLRKSVTSSSKRR
jgi:hypothetical protein